MGGTGAGGKGGTGTGGAGGIGRTLFSLLESESFDADLLYARFFAPSRFILSILCMIALLQLV